MLNKVGQFVTLSVTALTLIIMILFIAQQPNKDAVVNQNDVKKQIGALETKINERLAGIGNVKGIDTLHEQYKKIQQDQTKLEKDLKALQNKVDAIKTNKPSKTTPEKDTKEKPEVIQTEKVIAKDDHINVRSQPSTGGAIKYVLKKDEEMEVLEKEVIEKDGYGWVKVGLQNGQTGYVVREYLK